MYYTCNTGRKSPNQTRPVKSTAGLCWKGPVPWYIIYTVLATYATPHTRGINILDTECQTGCEMQVSNFLLPLYCRKQIRWSPLAKSWRVQIQYIIDVKRKLRQEQSLLFASQQKEESLGCLYWKQQCHHTKWGCICLFIVSNFCTQGKY